MFEVIVIVLLLFIAIFVFYIAVFSDGRHGFLILL